MWTAGGILTNNSPLLLAVSLMKQNAAFRLWMEFSAEIELAGNKMRLGFVLIYKTLKRVGGKILLSHFFKWVKRVDEIKFEEIVLENLSRRIEMKLKGRGFTCFVLNSTSMVKRGIWVKFLGE